MYKVCMFKLSQLSKFLHGRRKKKLLSKFRTKSSVNTSIARAYCSLRNEMGRNEMEICSLRNGNL